LPSTPIANKPARAAIAVNRPMLEPGFEEFQKSHKPHPEPALFPLAARLFDLQRTAVPFATGLLQFLIDLPS